MESKKRMRERDFVDLAGLMAAQIAFENSVRGTDASMSDLNDKEPP